MTNLTTILLVEDDRDMRSILRETLQKEGFLVLEAANAKRSVEILNQHPVSLVLLDLNLPDLCGNMLVSTVREVTTNPIIVISGEEDNHKKIESIKAGADDFIAKPVNFEMLLAKMEASFRRIEYEHAPSHNPYRTVLDRHEIRFCDWAIDIDKFQVFDKNRRSANLTIWEFKLLNCLIANAGRAMSRDELCETLRNENYVPTPRAIDIKIARIRKKIEADIKSPQIILTVRNIGYMFDRDKIHP